jgi:hypothetical protein
MPTAESRQKQKRAIGKTASMAALNTTETWIFLSRTKEQA